MSASTKIGIIGGAGWLGRAIAGSLIRIGKLPEDNLALSFRSRRPDILHDAFWSDDNQAVVDRSDVVIISVRPEDWKDLAADVGGKLLVSVMAGISADALSRRHNTRRVVRALPNAAAEVSLSYTPWLASSDVSEEDKAAVRMIFDACGTQDEVISEAELDYLTGLTGTGPAYPALLALAMLEDAQSRGVKPEVALRAVNGVIIGAGALLQAHPQHPQDILDAFLEYKGTTAAGLNAMKDNGFGTVVSGGLAAALERTLVMGRRALE
ncbi:pyrroline-5-carboxylate reductase family protein [Rhizobium leucaenae]|uniref:Pyrroline-5-carboxylate reductase n=1 Tax=Rhizobium leucaenae TaxID=29450 RepID=A0A7W6ZZP4_9HYPH|nr:pyrroline-5-carboxylate reductase dimerization domain-containing protein [Rhizobium leucaenae]MBB4571716.1 pyrroline-5-carboxylate reductase [Rhizobium leucaenae]MBB6305620.1 pyrroline-5-carboxylate reductase [Rhizobium leucaenae]